MIKKLLLLTCFGFFFASLAQAQTKKIHADPLIWADLQLDYFLSNQSFFFFRNQWRYNTDDAFGGVTESGPLSKFNEVYILGGYEQRFTDHWAASFLARYTFAGNNNTMFQGALRHMGHIGSIDFEKRVAFDYLKPEIGDSRGRIRPSVALERNFELGGRTLRPHFSYELFFYKDFQDNNSGIQTRTVDRTRMRLGASYQVASSFWITPYFLKQTEYYNVLDTYTGELDDQGNQIIKEAGGKRNRIEPVFGIDIRFVLKPDRVTDPTLPRLLR